MMLLKARSNSIELVAGVWIVSVYVFVTFP